MSMYSKNNKVDEEREFFAGLFLILSFICMCVTPRAFACWVDSTWHNHWHGSNGCGGYRVGNRTRRVQEVAPTQATPYRKVNSW